MPTPRFYGVATGDPVKLQRAIAPQVDPGVPPDENEYVDYLGNGGKLSLTPQWVEPQLIRGSSVRDSPIPGKLAITAEPQSMGDVDLGNVAQALLVGASLGRVTHSGSGAHHRYQFGAAQEDEAPPCVAILSDDDTGLVWRFTGVRPSGFSLAAQNAQNLALTVPIVSGPADLWGSPEQTAGEDSTLPKIRGTFLPGVQAGQLAPDATDADLHMKLIDDSPLQVKAKITAAASYSGATQNLAYDAFEGSFLRATYGSVVDYGFSRADQPRIYWPTGATLVANDEFKFPKRRERRTPSYGTRRPVGEVQARFYIGGIAIPVNGGYTVTMNMPGVVADDSPGFAQPLRTLRQGFSDVQVTLNRRLADMLIQTALLARSTLSLVVECVTDVLIGATVMPFGMTILCPNVVVTGDTVSVGTGQTTFEEQVVCLCKRAGTDYTFNGMTVDAEEEIGIVWDTDVSIPALGA